MEVLIVSKHHQCARFKGLKGKKTILSRDLFKINSTILYIPSMFFQVQCGLILQNIHI